ncbi:MAG: bifunctional glycosyltransferase family 2 protein/class I SAM-dependent methyltransferase [Acidobacteria bacterium]|jgi:GT2 family glycosyltransferase/2-polyprenyl-3-methyl-5-hydroxy-6-metoxy-1,4-benzoquinol methylase|nr:bifunctional glycosyltransferase family 2 protein/class I SAM-dependent methyltransferase [Acidobacteriota bacterium]
MVPRDPRAEVEGQAFSNPVGSAQAYFGLERPHRLANRELEIEVEVFGDAAAEIRIDYDSIDHSVQVVPQHPGAFKRTSSRSLRPSGDWERLRFRLDDARFCGRLNSGDFRVVSSRPHGPLFVRSVFVRATANRETSDARAPWRNGSAAFDLPNDPDPEVSIVIPVWNHLAMTLECLRALRSHTEGSYEVVVVDNGSSPRAEAVLGRIRNLRLHRHESNLGFARACNEGARRARGRHVLFLNNDTIPQPGWLPPLLAAFRKDPHIDVAGSLLLYPDTGEVQHAGVDIEPGMFPVNRYRFHSSGTPEVNRDAVVPAVTGACLLTSRDCFDRLGGFDEGFVNGFEDVDFCLRVGEAGGLCYYCADSVLLHHESATPGRLDPQRQADNLAQLHRRWRHVGGDRRWVRDAHRPRGADREGVGPFDGGFYSREPGAASSRYSCDIDLEELNDSHSLAIMSVRPGSRVLDIGAGDGSVARVLAGRGCRVSAVERDESAAREASDACEHVAVGDIENLDLEQALAGRRFDFVLLLDVLEHLREPLATLERAAAVLAPGGRIIASIPNVAHGAVRLALLRGSFEYTETGLLDRTHLRFFDRRGVEGLFREARLDVLHWLRTMRGLAETEIPIDPQAFPPAVVNELARDPEATTYQFVIVAVSSADSIALRGDDPLPESLQKHVLATARRFREVETCTRSPARKPAAG